MNKTAASNEQYLTRSGSFATRPSRTGTNLLNWGAGEEEQLTTEQRRDVLTRALQATVEAIKEINAGFKCKSVPKVIAKRMMDERDALVARQLDLTAQLSAMRAERRKTSAQTDFIIQVIKERVSELEWQSILDEAKRRTQEALHADA